jgi:hypothetical protein
VGLDLKIMLFFFRSVLWGSFAQGMIMKVLSKGRIKYPSHEKTFRNNFGINPVGICPYSFLEKFQPFLFVFKTHAGKEIGAYFSVHV